SGGGGSGGGGGCSPANCAGCCFGGACQAGVSASACGKNGASCTSCESWQICASTQSCAVDPQSRWSLVPISAAVATTRPSDGTPGEPFGGAPDLSVSWQDPAGTQLGATAYVPDSFPATWPAASICPGTAATWMSTGWAVVLYDDDSPATPDVAGGWPFTF